MLITYRFWINIDEQECSSLLTKNSTDLLKFFNEMSKYCIVEKSSRGYDLYVRNDSLDFWRIGNICEKYDRTFPNECVFEYSDDEICHAKYFSLHCTWSNGYPFPESRYLEQSFVNPNNDFKRCDCQLRQIAPISLQRIPNWKKRNFMGLFWLHDTLFCNDKVKNLFEMHRISGIEFLPVMHKTNGVLDGTFQVKIINQSHIERSFFQNEYREQQICKTCGTSFVFPSFDYISKYDIDHFDIDCDIFYGSGPFNRRNIIITKRVYELLKVYGLSDQLRLKVIFTRDQFEHIYGIPQLNSYNLNRASFAKSTLYKLEDENNYYVYPGKEDLISTELKQCIPVFLQKKI